MLVIRLQRKGKRNDPFYRVVVTEKLNKLEGSEIDVLGTWHPREKAFDIEKKKFSQWVDKGARPSPAVAKLVK